MGNPGELSQILAELKDLTGFRDWKAKAGDYKVRGKYVGLKLASQTVVVQKVDGKTVSPPLALLSEEDVSLVSKISTLQTRIANTNAALIIKINQENKTRMTELAAELAKARMELAAANTNLSRIKPPAGAATVPEVSAKRLEAVGAKYVGKKVKFMNVRKVAFSNTGFTTTGKVKAYVGDALGRSSEVADWGSVRFFDSNGVSGDIFDDGFAKGDEFAEVILDLDGDEKVNIYGTVHRYQYAGSEQYGLTIETIEKSAK